MFDISLSCVFESVLALTSNRITSNTPIRRLNGGRYHRSILKPLIGGSASTRTPYWLEKYFFISFSDHPADNFSRIVSRHWIQAWVPHASRGILSHTGQYNCLLIAFTSSSVGLLSWATTLPRLPNKIHVTNTLNKTDLVTHFLPCSDSNSLQLILWDMVFSHSKALYYRFMLC